MLLVFVFSSGPEVRLDVRIKETQKKDDERSGAGFRVTVGGTCFFCLCSGARACVCVCFFFGGGDIRGLYLISRVYSIMRG